jgi:hypothetical protein
MWNHFKELGKWQKGGTGDVGMGEQIFQELKTRLGEGGRFFKKSNYSGELFEVDDSVARQSEYQDPIIILSIEIQPNLTPPPQKYYAILNGEWNQVASGWTKRAYVTPQHQPRQGLH